ncbi:hypothetical protein SAMN05216419_101165 [Nitrosomonas cryotolerans]|nr:hypothetical protein SAMN05216419_101165 [Nitrosomonas cryotolerans]
MVRAFAKVSKQYTPPLYPLARQGHLGKRLEVLIDDPGYEWLVIEASHCKAHSYFAGAKGGNQNMSRTKGDSTLSYIWP